MGRMLLGLPKLLVVSLQVGADSAGIGLWQGIARRLIDLKALLPNVNVSRLVAGSPTLLLHADMDSMTKNLEELR